MAKRRSEDPPVLQCPLNKRHCAPLSVVGSPPSLLALLGRRSRKRPQNFEEPDMDTVTSRVTALCSCEHACSVGTCTNKRLRRESTDSNNDVRKKCDQADGETDAEDSTFNSFQYWRVPLPELDLSLLEDKEECQTKNELKVKDSSSDTMEA